MTFAVWNTSPSRTEEFIGAAVAVTNASERLTHAGIVYGRSNQAPMFLHLASDMDLRNHAMSSVGRYHWDVCHWIDAQADRENYLFLLTYFEVIAQHAKTLRYRPKAPQDQFDAAGNPLPTADDEGVTCATFVALVFKGARLPIVDLATWQPREGDKEWQEFVYRILGGDIGTLPADPPPFRLLPCEVASAAVHSDVPVDFETAQRLAKPLEQLLFPPMPSPATAELPRDMVVRE